MHALHNLLVWTHIAAGSFGLLSFWIPTLTRKGGSWHRRAGTGYARAMYIVAATALVMSLIRMITPLSILPEHLIGNEQATSNFVRQSQLAGAFLGVLALLVFANVRHGLLVLRSKDGRRELRSRLHLATLFALMLAGAIGIYAGIRTGYLLLQIFAPLGLINGVMMLRYSFKRELKKSEWIIEHLNNLLAAGIATHTAVLVFGASRFVNTLLPGFWNLLPWIAPGVIGLIASTLWARHYRRKLGHYGITAPQLTAVQPSS